MLISVGHLHPSLPPKTTADLSLQPFTVPKPLILRKLSKYSKPLIRSSASDTHSRTLPHSAIHRIAEKLRSLGFTETPTSKTGLESKGEENSAGEIFIPLPEKLPKPRVGRTLDPSWSMPENPVPMPGSGTWMARVNELKGEVKRYKEQEKLLGKKKEEKLPTLAELKLSKEELRRLQTVGIRLTTKMKVGKAGITEGIVNGIHERWRKEEVVKIVCEDLCRVNMNNTHNLLERKTGGLVVWRSGSKILLYRGDDYKYPYFYHKNSTNETSLLVTPHMDYERSSENEYCSSSTDGTSAGPSSTDKLAQSALIRGVGVPNRVRFQLPGEAELSEEADRLIDGLGPRFTDWWGYDPQPVDADLLPAIVPGYRRPFRLLPYGVNPKLTGDEMTILRRLGRPLPCHFALGRNRKHQGLATAIIKLWEKCEVAKIAVKRGVQNTNSEMMAEELKWLTGGTLIARDREFIVLYRGKDFLPPAVSLAIEERRMVGVQKEKQMSEHLESGMTAQEFDVRNVESGSEVELDEANNERTIILEQRKTRSTEETIKTTSLKLSMALEKKTKAEKLLAELEKADRSGKPEIDKEGITEEERYMLRRVGLRMKPFLLMGRRGVFDGTVENMHLHWKYRELVKIICKEKSTKAIHQVARSLETESGGILVAVERVNRCYGIIMYRGKNYTRPSRLRPSTLLSKRQAMKRSKEAQRHESLKLHVLKLTRNISELKLQLDEDMEAQNMQSIDESTSQLVKEEISSMQAAEDAQSDIELMAGHQSSSELPEVEEVKDKHVADSTSPDLNDGMNVTFESLQATQQDQTDTASMRDVSEISKAEPAFSCQSIRKETHSEGMRDSAIGDAQHCGSDNNAMFSSDESTRNKMEPLFSAVEKNKSMEGKLIEIPSTSVRLSNRERLILRKQALKMKKRPPFAVGRSNIVTGVAKAIKFHFQRNPLAIVNIKGRAKGTSVQEVVFKLEKATGGVLVSQEPSKVIIYRGWGADDVSEHKKKDVNDVWRPLVNRKHGIRPAISSELLAAIRLECGLQNKEEFKANPGAAS
ncbi:CRM-domain containing factor CFM2, chloroplastic isoform X2 [Tripterygium wilfordii]|uniref:CRM-domain containing factor CFM2, chloroplastic isoform X2 n=1 Tax=Tripterygium wilfordii TaxID=458696 RepID=UPI0018F830D9|nr:CRM-domain containing factor CFM2, chloroplastic isoform X2 [Tripterygium wilfordii]